MRPRELDVVFLERGMLTVSDEVLDELFDIFRLPCGILQKVSA